MTITHHRHHNGYIRVLQVYVRCTFVVLRLQRVVTFRFEAPCINFLTYLTSASPQRFAAVSAKASIHPCDQCTTR